MVEDEISFEEAIGRLTAYDERSKSQDTLEANDQDKLLMPSSNNKTYGKWRGKDFNKEAKESMKWKNNPNARRASTRQETKDKIKLRKFDPTDKVDMHTSFRPGDIVKASVIFLGDARAYYLSTAQNELGVVSAESMARATMDPISWTEM
nr:exosome complex component CSL4 [Tanacetum cinerariifolium]